MIALVIIVTMTLAACSSGKNQTAGGGGVYKATNDNMAYAPEAPAMAPMPAPEASMEYAAADRAPEMEVYEEVQAIGADAGFAGELGNVLEGRKITFRAALSINTKSFDADYAAINNMIRQYGGFISSEEMSDYTSYGYNEGRRTWIVARIPASGYDSFLDGITAIGNLTNLSKSSDDLTAQYFDTEARIEMLEIRKERLMGYLVKAEEASDIVEFERELANVLFELDQFQSSKRHLDRLVDYATIDINLTELITPETIGKDGEPLGDRASEAFLLSKNGVARFLEGLVVFFAGAAPVLALLAVIGLIVWAIVRITRKPRERAREKREERHIRREQQLAQKRAQLYQEQYAQQAFQQQGQQVPPQQQTPPLQGQQAPPAPQQGQTPPQYKTPFGKKGDDKKKD